MKVSAINTSMQCCSPRKYQTQNITRNKIQNLDNSNVAFGDLKSAGKGAIAGGIFGAALFGLAGAALPLVAVFAIEEAVCGAIIGHAVSKGVEKS